MNKKLYLVLVLTFLVNAITLAQLVNINPDPNGEPWIVNDATVPHQEVLSKAIPITLSTASELTQLDPVVDNSQLDYFPEIFHQGSSGACVHVAEVAYTFTYELNRINGTPAGNWTNNKYNIFHPFFTYNFQNNGNYYSGTDYTTGYTTIIDNSCPEFHFYDDPALYGTDLQKGTYWLNGYQNYYKGMNNKTANTISIHWSNTLESLDLLKHWLNDHNEGGNSPGGLATIATFMEGFTIGWIPTGSPEAGKHFIYNWGPSAIEGHAMTIVGYNDEIHCKDIDNNGLYENYDRDGNGQIELHECEKGAFKIANSWGEYWPVPIDEGFIYAPYSIFESGLQIEHTVYSCLINENYETELAINVEVECGDRSQLKFYSAYSPKANINSITEEAGYNVFNYQGGEFDMRGEAYEGPIEIGLDFGYHFIEDDFGKIFLKINKLGNNPIGFLNHFSIIDYRWNEIFELDCQDLINGPLQLTGQGNTIAFVNYDLIPHETPITQNLLLDSDMVSRFQPSVTSGAQLTVADNVNIDMYNSTITIDASSSLVLGNGVQFAAKTGNCKLIINGNATFDDNLSFIAENNATLEIEINNTATNAQFDGAIFTQCQISSQAESLHFINSTFTQCGTIASYRGNISCNNSEFIESSLDFVNSGKNNDEAIITNCSFYSDANTVDAININAYTNYKIENCNIENFQGLNTGYLKGILIENSGGGADYNNISFNEIKDCIETAIVIYNSVADISLNNIHNNGNGIKLFDYSNVTVTGNSSAQNNSGTQQISNNTFTEIFATYGSFPSIMEYNVIIDDDNMGYEFDPLVYYANTNSKDNLKLIANNCW